MTAALERLRAALDGANAPVEFFFRNDDGGWEQEALFRLLQIAAAFGVVIDLAAIPAAMTDGQAKRISEFAARTGAVRIHQHGFMHANHESDGRKCEFGAARARARQWLDIKLGKARLADFFSAGVDPIFTPPWNRCTQGTVAALKDEGFLALSRDDTAAPLDLSGLYDIRVNADWRAPDSTRAKYAGGGAGRIADLVAAGERRIGVMTHHAVMDDALFESFEAMLGVLADHPRAAFTTIMQCVRAAEAPAAKNE